MSQTIDEKVVKMSFDNSNFEKNAKQSLNTLDRLKERLHFKREIKDVESLNYTMNSFDTRKMDHAIGLVEKRFSVMGIAGMTAVNNITNSMMNFGKNVVRSLTTAPVKTGFQEYELKMNSIKTIMASTGEELKTVNRYLNELNEYSDKTIYNFADMTNNIGKFTNAGIKLEDAVYAIKGISNEAAVSGATAAEASRAMYNFSQALSSGYVQLIDWKSIELANMATDEFKQQLIDTAVEVGTLTKVTDGYKAAAGDAFTSSKHFRDELKNQWLTSEVLINTLKKYADETEGIGKKAFAAAQDINTISKLYDTLKETVQSGWAQTWEIVIGDAEKSQTVLTKIGTKLGDIFSSFSDKRNEKLKGILNDPFEEFEKEIESCGISMDDFRKQATKVAKSYNIDVEKMIKQEGSFEKTLKRRWLTKDIVIDTLGSFAEATNEVGESTDALNDKLNIFQKIVDDVWLGDYQNGEERVKALTEAGYEYAEVQRLVNLTVDGHRLTLSDLNVEEMKNLGYTDEQIEKIQILKDKVNDTSSAIGMLVNRLGLEGRREQLINAFKHLGEQFKKITDAWKKAKESLDMGDKEPIIARIIDKFIELSEAINISEESATNFQHISEGILSIWTIITGYITINLRNAIRIFDAVLKLFGTTFGDVLAKIADGAEWLSKWMESNTWYINTIDKIAETIKHIADEITIFKNNLKNAITTNDKFAKTVSIINKKIEALKQGFTDARKAVVSLFNFEGEFSFVEFIKQGITNIRIGLEEIVLGADPEHFGVEVISGFIQGIVNGTAQLTLTAWTVFSSFLANVANVLEIHSPSKATERMGEQTMTGFQNGLENGANSVRNTISAITEKFKQLFADLTLNEMFVGGYLVFAAATINKIINIFSGLLKATNLLSASIATFAKDITTIGSKIVNMFSGVSKILDNAAKYIGAETMLVRAKAFKEFAIAITILAAAIVLLSYIPADRIAKGIIAMTGVIILLGALSLALGKFSAHADWKSLVTATLFVSSLVPLITTMAIITKIFSKMNGTELVTGIIGLGAIIIAISVLMKRIAATTSGITVEAQYKAISRIGNTMMKIGISMLAIAVAIKMISGISVESLGKAAIVVISICAFAATLNLFEKLNSSANISKFLLSFAGSLILLSAAIRLIGSISIEEIVRAISTIAALETLLIVLGAFSAFVEKKYGSGKNIPFESSTGTIKSIAGTLIKLGIAMMLISISARMMSRISISDLGKAAAVLIAMGGFIAVLMMLGNKFLVSGSSNKDLAGQLLGVSDTYWSLSKVIMSIGISMIGIALAMKIIATIDQADITKSTVAISSVLMGFAFIVGMTSYAGEHADKASKVVKGVANAMLVMATAMMLLSLIDEDRLMASVAAVSVIMLLFSATIAASRLAGTAQKSMMIITGCLIALVSMITLLSMLDEQDVLFATKSIALLIGALGVMYAGLSLLKTPNWKVYATIGLYTAIVVAIAGLFTYLASNIGDKAVHAIPIAVSLMAFMFSFSILAKVVAGFALIGAPAIVGLKYVAILAAALLGAIVAIGFLSDKVSGFKSTILNGLDVIKEIAIKFGEIHGGFIHGFLSESTDDIDVIGERLSKFSNSIIDMAKSFGSFSAESIENVKRFGEFLKIISEAVSIGIGDADDKRLETLGNNLNSFGPVIVSFYETVKNVKGSELQMIAKGIKTMAQSLKITEELSFNTDFDALGNNLESLGRCVVRFQTSMQEVDVARLTEASNAGLTVIKMAKELPSSNGFLQKIIGEKDIQIFGAKLISFGNSIISYRNIVSGVSDWEPIELSKTAVLSVIDIAKSLPESGSIKSLIFGNQQDMADFGISLVSFGESLVNFNNSLTSVSDWKALDSGLDATEKVIKLMNMLKVDSGNGGFWSKVGTAFSGKIGKTSLSSIGNSLGHLAKGIKTFANKMKEIELSDIESAGEKIKEITSAMSECNVDISPVKDMSSDLSQMSLDMLALIETTSKFPKDFGSKFMKEWEKQVKTIKVKLPVSIDTIKIKIANKKSDFESAGKSLIEGFSAGMEDNKYLAEQAAEAVALAAIKSLNTSLDINSPSKKAMMSGKYLDEGLGIGIEKSSAFAERKAESLGSRVIASMNNALLNAKAKVSSNIDINPTITPILDFKNVQDSAARIGSILNGQPLAFSNATVNHISSMEYSKNQNAENHGIVSAIKDLKTSLAENRGDTYSWNGTTISSDSDIATAIDILTKAAIRERRN